MEKFPEFVANHLFLFSLLIAILSLLIWNIYGDIINGIKQLTPSETTRMINHENAVLIDVRNQEDFALGHILNALNINIDEIKNKIKDLEKFRDKPIILYCANGSVSGRAARMLKIAGLEKTFLIKGGVAAWRNANLPLTRESEV